MTERNRARPRKVDESLHRELLAGESITFSIKPEENRMFRRAGRASGFQVTSLDLEGSTTYPTPIRKREGTNDFTLEDTPLRDGQQVVVITRPPDHEYHNDFWEAVRDERHAQSSRRRPKGKS